MKEDAEALQAAMAASSELEEEKDEDGSDDEQFDSSDDEEEVEWNAYEHNGVCYHRDEETGELNDEDGEYFGYIDSDGEVHEGEKPEEE